MRKLSMLMVGIAVATALLSFSKQCFALGPGDVEIEVYKTSAEKDDLVPLGSSILCRVKVKNNPETDPNIVLTRNNSKISFNNGAETLSLTLDKGGEWNEFVINGMAGSQSKDDVTIEAHKDTATGELLGDENASVYWFDDPNLVVSVGGYYGISSENEYKAITGNQHAVDYAAWTTVRPSGLDGSAPQLTNVRVGIVQNALSLEAKVTWESPEFIWYPTAPTPLTITIHSVYSRNYSYQGKFNDSAPDIAPLYDRPGFPYPKTIDPNSLKVPLGLSGGGTARSHDNPSLFFPTTARHIVKYNNNDVGYVTYSSRVKATRSESFQVWAVFFDISTESVSPFRQSAWSLEVDSSIDSNVTPQKATPATPLGGTNVTDNPNLDTESGKFANDKSIASEVESFAGVTTTHSR